MANIIRFGGGSSAEGTAVPGNVISGKTFTSDASDDLQTGTLSIPAPVTFNVGRVNDNVVSGTFTRPNNAVVKYAMHNYSERFQDGPIYFQGSNDGSYWVNLDSVYTNTWAGERGGRVGTNSSYRYYRFYQVMNMGEDGDGRSGATGMIAIDHFNF